MHNHFGKNEVLKGVNLDIGRGEALALVGESGSGKSVTAQAIMGLLGPAALITDGHICFDNKTLNLADENLMRSIRGKRIGMIFQDPMNSLNPTMTVGRQIAEILKTHHRMSATAACEKAIQLIHAVGIRDAAIRCDAYPFELSGGMRQRIMIAMAIACKPDLLIADEPTTALDVTVQAQILALLRGLISEYQMSLLFITHDLRVAASLCSRVVVMFQGAIVETGLTSSTFTDPQHEYTRGLLNACQLEFSHV